MAMNAVSERSAGLRAAGQGLVEYALILALIAILAIGALGIMSSAINSTLSTVGGSI
jgi:Flp pilus assembly pilin Flp